MNDHGIEIACPCRPMVVHVIGDHGLAMVDHSIATDDHG